MRPHGLSLIELLLGVALTAFVVSLGAYLLKGPSKFVKNVTEGLENSTLADLEGRSLVDRFSRTYPMRRGFFTCGRADITALLEGRAPFGAPLAPATSADTELTTAFAIAYADYSTLGAVSTGNTMTVPDTRHFHDGAMVLLTLVNQPTVGGVFQVASFDDAQFQITLAADPVAPPKEFPCTIQNSLGLTDLLKDPRNVIAGKPTKNLRVDVVRIVKYVPTSDPANHRLKLVEHAWPVPDTGGLLRQAVVADGFKSLKIENASWAPDDPAGSPNGIFFANLTVKREEELTSSAGRGIASRPSSRRIGYNTATGGVTNAGAVTAPPSVALTFPTCGITAVPVQDRFSRDDDHFAPLYRVSGQVADAPSVARLDLIFSSPGATQPTCWTSDGAYVGGGNRLKLRSDSGVSGGASIGPDGSGGMTSLICQADNGSTFSGTLQYFDAANNFIVHLPCSPATVAPTGATYGYPAGSAPTSCYKNGTVFIGQLTVSGSSPAQPGPTLYLGDDGCNWANPPSSPSCAPNPAQGDLLSINLRPVNIPGDNTFANPVTCGNPPGGGSSGGGNGNGNNGGGGGD